MITESKVTEIFCIADDFCKEFEVEMAKIALGSSPSAPKRRRKQIINFVLTRANVDDRNEMVFDTLTDKVFGKLYADKGYISQSLFGKLFDDGIHIVTGLRSNMKQRLMPLYDKIMLRKRSIIE